MSSKLNETGVPDEVLDGDVEGQWHAVEVGAGVPVVLLHDLFGSAEDFDGAVDLLCEERRCVTVDLPGHGRSAPISSDTTMAALADELGDLLGILGAEPCVLAGQGYGGLLALEFSRRHPDRLIAAVTIATDLRPQLSASEAVERLGDPDFLDAYFPSLFSTRFYIDHPGRARDEREVLAAFDPARVAALAAAFDACDPPSGDSGVAIPLLALAGGADARFAHQQFAKEYANIATQTELIERCGHDVAVEAPDELARLIDGFIDKIT